MSKVHLHVPAWEHLNFDQELRIAKTEAAKLWGDTPVARDLAAALALVPNKWFESFLAELGKLSPNRAFSVAHVAERAQLNPELTEPGGFGVDPKDPERLLELRQAIDSYLGWKSQEDEEHGDYVFRIREIGDMLWNVKAAFTEFGDADLMARILLSVTKNPSPIPPERLAALGTADTARPREPVGDEAQLQILGILKQYGFVSVDKVHGAIERLHKLEGERGRLLADAAASERLAAKNKRQRSELRRFNREAKVRAEGSRGTSREGTVDCAYETSAISDEAIERLRSGFPFQPAPPVATIRSWMEKFEAAGLLSELPPELFGKRPQ